MVSLGGSLLVAVLLGPMAAAASAVGLFAYGLVPFMLLLAGGLVLLAYGCVVNAPRWDFGRLLGVYVAAFFVVAQSVAWLAIRQSPTPAV